MSIGATLQALTASLQDNGLGPSLEALTGELAGQQGPVGQITVSFSLATGAFASPGNVDATLAGTLNLLTGTFGAPAGVAVTIELPTGAFVGVLGTLGDMSGVLAVPTMALAGVSPHLGSITASLQAPTVSAAGLIVLAGTFAASMRAPAAALVGVMGVGGSISASLKQPTAALSAYIQVTGSIAASLPRPWGYAAGAPAVDGSALETWAMNTRNNAVTRYPSFPANSFARYNGTYIAAGPAGIYTLGGDLESDANWQVRTGQLDDKKAGLKRLTEVLLGVRYAGPVTVRVWKDEETYYDYALPNLKPDVLQQVRAKVGKGLRSRYFKIELLGTGGRFELDSLQASMPETSRRVG